MESGHALADRGISLITLGNRMYPSKRPMITTTGTEITDELMLQFYR